jgi:hypothetical protein
MGSSSLCQGKGQREKVKGSSFFPFTFHLSLYSLLMGASATNGELIDDREPLGYYSLRE